MINGEANPVLRPEDTTYRKGEIQIQFLLDECIIV